MKYDIFISYRRNGGSTMAKLLYECLKNMGYNVFLDVDELNAGPFNERLYQVIDDCKDFLIVLPPDSLERCKAENDWLRVEVERALKGNKNIIPITLEGFNWNSVTDDYPESIKRLSRYNDVQIVMLYFDAGIKKILTMLLSQTDKNSVEIPQTETASVRNENRYFTFDDKKELRRLAIQQELIKTFEGDIYTKISERYDELRILDLGSNNGSFIMDRIGKDPKVSKIIGIEYDEQCVAYANKTYGGNGKISFYQSDVESDEFSDKLSYAMQEQNVQSFNFVNISMLLLHLKSPYKLLKAIRKFIAPGGTILIKDIDDGFNIAYPDDDGAFKRVVDICARNKTAGYRYSGRQIYTFLKRSGYRNIKLENLGLSTIGMGYEEREALFDTYFSFIPDDLEISVKNNPDNQQFKADLKWIRGIYDELEERFQDDGFFFSLGTMLYSAEK